MLNVRDMRLSQTVKNQEIQELMQAIGLKPNTDYKNPEHFASLRYGKVMLMTDQDFDGSHIKGLFLNFVDTYWPSLLERKSFLSMFVTPLVKAKKGSNHVEFYSMSEYEAWKSVCEPSSSNSHPDANGFRIAKLDGEVLQGSGYKYCS